MLGTEVKALKLFLKINCYIAEKSRAVAMVTTFTFTKQQKIPIFFHQTQKGSTIKQGTGKLRNEKKRNETKRKQNPTKSVK